MNDWLADALRELGKYRSLAERAVAQVPDERWFTRLDPESNSLALVMKHMAGNMRSRWTDVLTSDGEKPDRHRDQEFEILSHEDEEEIFRQWEQGWQCLFNALEPLTAEDLGRTIEIRGEPHSVPQAMVRQLSHYAEHVGQIVFLAKHLRSSEWQSLSIPRGRSEEVLARMKQRLGK